MGSGLDESIYWVGLFTRRNYNCSYNLTVATPHKVKTSLLTSVCLLSYAAVFCVLSHCLLLVSSLPEAGSGRTVWRLPPSTIELLRSSLLLCFGGSLSWIWAFNQVKLYYVYQNP
jgi:hypothetical protein